MKKVATIKLKYILPNLFCFFLLMLSIIALNSCENNNVELQEGEEKTTMETVELSINLKAGIVTRDEDSIDPESGSGGIEGANCGICSGSEINRLFYKAFELIDGELEENDSEPLSIGVTDISKTKVTIRLDRTKAYKIFFWAQHVGEENETFTSPYSLSRDMVVTVNYDNIFNNDERLDAFYGSLEYDWKTEKTDTRVILYRPFAQVNIGSIIADWLPSGFYNKKYVMSTMTISNVASKFSIITGKVLKEEGAAKYDVMFDFNYIFNGPTQDLEYLEPEEQEELSQGFKNAFLYVDFNSNNKIDQSPTTPSSDSSSSSSSGNSSSNNTNGFDWWRYERSRYISMAYFLVDSHDDLESASDVVDVRFRIGYYPNEGDGENESSGFVLPFEEMLFDNVSVRPNYRTNIVGALFSKQQRIYVNLSPLYDGIFTNRDEENGIDDSIRLHSKESMGKEGYDAMEEAFGKTQDSDIEELFEKYGFYDQDRGVKCFVLNEDIDDGGDILQIHWDYILYGNGHTVYLKKQYTDYYNFGPVRNLYIGNKDNKEDTDKLYIDDNGYVWYLDRDGKWRTQWYHLHTLDGSDYLKSYDVYCSDGYVKKSNHYPTKNN